MPPTYAASRATADVALIKLAKPLAELVQPATLAAPRRVAVGETLIVAGFGVTAAGTDRGLGVPRMATLTVTGKPGALQIRLYDLATRNLRAGLGACVGDSGAPVFETAGAAAGQVIGVVSWSTAPGNEEGCGGLTGVTPLLLYRAMDRRHGEEVQFAGRPITLTFHSASACPPRARPGAQLPVRGRRTNSESAGNAITTSDTPPHPTREMAVLPS